MPTFASIPVRSLRITGWPHSGWRTDVDDSDPTSRMLPFRFAIKDDGSGSFLLIFESLDGVYFNDTWHHRLEEAFASATECFGIACTEWTRHDETGHFRPRQG